MEVNYVSRDTNGMYENSSVSGAGPFLMGADSLLGNDVYNASGEKLGIIKEFMIEMDTGRISYAVLSFGGFLGLGDRLFAVPWESLRLNARSHRFVLDVPKETLKEAPGFDKHHWPSIAGRFYSTN
jgi:hypothetical protein